MQALKGFTSGQEYAPGIALPVEPGIGAFAHLTPTQSQKRSRLYASKGVFRSFAHVLTSNKVVYYRMQWHKDRFF